MSKWRRGSRSPERPQTPWIDVEEIKQQVSVEDVLAHFGLLAQMKRRGDTLSGLSPFRDEQNASFFARRDGGKSIWNTFPGRPVVEGKEVPGNVVGLMMALANVPFREALVRLHVLRGGNGSQATAENAAEISASPTSRDVVRATVGRDALDELSVPRLPETQEVRAASGSGDRLEQAGSPTTIEETAAGTASKLRMASCVEVQCADGPLIAPPQPLTQRSPASVSADGDPWNQVDQRAREGNPHQPGETPAQPQEPSKAPNPRPAPSVAQAPPLAPNAAMSAPDAASLAAQANVPFGRQLSGLRFDIPFLEQRGLSPERARYYGVGYYGRSGLMKSRVVVPIRNRDRQLVAYVGRSLKDDDPDGKWKFPSGFRKSLELYGADMLANDKETRRAVRRHGLIVVEGAFDRLWLVERGFKNTVALLGSSASEEQVDMLLDSDLNPTGRVRIFLDNDQAGRAARKQLCGQLIYRGFPGYVDFARVNVGDRTDPDQFSRDELRLLLGEA